MRAKHVEFAAEHDWFVSARPLYEDSTDDFIVVVRERSVHSCGGIRRTTEQDFEIADWHELREWAGY